MFKIKSIAIKKNRNGFTLIELIVVIAIVGILSSIAVPRLSGFLEKARIKADQASLSTLNKATSMYAALNNINDDDIFARDTDDLAKMEVLVNAGLLQEIIKAQQRDSSFAWDIDEQKWVCHEGMSIAEAKEKGFIFSDKDDGTISITEYKGLDKNIEIPYKIGGVLVTEIGIDAFKDKGLTSVKIPNTVKKLQGFAFYENKLETVKIPFGVTLIGQSVFANNKLTSVELSNSVGTIGDNAFKNNKITSITFPASVEAIGRMHLKKIN